MYVLDAASTVGSAVRARHNQTQSALQQAGLNHLLAQPGPAQAMVVTSKVCAGDTLSECRAYKSVDVVVEV